jgi:hypothetical protein
VSDEAQRTLEGLIVTDPKTLAEIVEKSMRKVLKESEDLGWDKRYKGDAYWLELRAHTLARITADVAIDRHSLDEDPWFAINANIRTDVQWVRALDQHLVPNKPVGPDGLRLTKFRLGPRRGTYVTRRDWLHCAIKKIAEERGIHDPSLVQKVRARYNVSARCGFCTPQTATPTTDQELLKVLATATTTEER